MREDHSDITRRTRIFCSSRPTELMIYKVGELIIGKDSLNDARRDAYIISRFRCQIAEEKIICEMICNGCETSKFFKHLFPGYNCRAESEFDSFELSRYKGSEHEFTSNADCLHYRREVRTADCSIEA